MVSLTDVDYGLDLACALHSAGEHIHLHLSRRHAYNYLGDNPHIVDSFYELGLLPQIVNLHFFEAPRMRDPRSYPVMHRLSQTMQEEGVDVAHLLVGSGDLWTAILACMLRYLPVCSTMIIPKRNIGDRLPAPIVVGVNQILAWASDVIVVNGKTQVAFVQEKYRLPASRVHYVPLGPRDTTVRWAKKHETEQPGLILFFGRVDPHKGTEYLVRTQPIITRQVDNARIVIAGYGSEFEHCRQLIQDPSRFKLYEGFVSNEMAASLFQKASVVVLPYITASSSGVLSTAQSFGKPVVATRVGALAEYVEDGITGLLVPPADESELAAAIVKLLQNDELRHQMGKNAIERVNVARNETLRQTKIALGKAIERHSKTKK